MLRAEDRSEKFLDKEALKGGVVSACLPWGGELRLVLRGDSPDGHPVLLVGGDEERDVPSPRRHHSSITSQTIRSVAACHLGDSLVVLDERDLHPGRGTPGRSEELNGSPRLLHRSDDEWDDLVCVVQDL
jgi:hypothetical protein